MTTQGVLEFYFWHSALTWMPDRFLARIPTTKADDGPLTQLFVLTQPKQFPRLGLVYHDSSVSEREGFWSWVWESRAQIPAAFHKVRSHFAPDHL